MNTLIKILKQNIVASIINKLIHLYQGRCISMLIFIKNKQNIKLCNVKRIDFVVVIFNKNFSYILIRCIEINKIYIRLILIGRQRPVMIIFVRYRFIFLLGKFR